jgi:hypothetical protein
VVDSERLVDNCWRRHNVQMFRGLCSALEGAIVCCGWYARLISPDILEASVALRHFVAVSTG